MSIDAADPQDRAEQLLRITQRLTALMETEKNALDQGELTASSRDWDEKERLARVYRLEMRTIAQDPSRLAGITAPLKKTLQRAIQSFQAILTQHGAALESAKNLTEGLVRAISQEVATDRAPPTAYAASGKIAGRQNTASAQGIALNAQA